MARNENSKDIPLSIKISPNLEKKLTFITGKIPISKSKIASESIDLFCDILLYINNQFRDNEVTIKGKKVDISDVNFWMYSPSINFICNIDIRDFLKERFKNLAANGNHKEDAQ